MYAIFIEQYNDVLQTGKNELWTSAIKKNLESLGFAYVWLNINDYIDVNMLNRRQRDQYIQTWFENINNLSKLYYYAKMKNMYCFEDYLTLIRSEKLRMLITRLRLASYDLEIEIGRHNRIDRNNRICKLCNSNAIETEFHFVMVCPLYKDLRRKYIPFSSWPTVNRFIRYMALSNKVMLLKIAHFLENAFKIRSEKIANMNI